MNSVFATLKNTPWLIFILVSIVFVALGDYYAKKWSLEGRQLYFVIACVSSLLSGAFYFPVLLKNGLVVTSLVWTVLSIVTFFVVGFFVFHESVTVTQAVGIVLGIAATILMSL